MFDFDPGKEIVVDVPQKLAPLLRPARYKGAHGGRGGAKSHFFAGKLVALCRRKPTRWVCIREVQNSIRESVRQLIIDKIDAMGLGWFFEVREQEIRAQNGSLIVFKGMQSYNAANIKSLEDFDGAWVEEAQTLSEYSLRMLRPTIRKPNSEIWFSWNPRHDTDAVDKFLRGPTPPDDSIVVEVNWQDNPWFPDVLLKEMQQDYANDPEMAEHVWGGGYEIVSEGAYYARLIAQAEKDGRIGHYPYDPALPVITSWDIGVDDYTAVWFWQENGTNATVIDYWETHDQGADDVVASCMPEIFIKPEFDDRFADWSREFALQELDRTEPFQYGKHYLPHDIKMREWGAGARSRVQSLMKIGVKPIHKGAQNGPAERIAATRSLLPLVRFHRTPRVDQGLKRLRRYRRRWNDHMQTYQGPLHDESSHGADAFGEYAINCPFTRDVPMPARQTDTRRDLTIEITPTGGIAANMSISEIVAQKVRQKRLAEFL